MTASVVFAFTARVAVAFSAQIFMMELYEILISV